MYMVFILQVSWYFCYEENFQDQKCDSLGGCRKENLFHRDKHFQCTLKGFSSKLPLDQVLD